MYFLCRLLLLILLITVPCTAWAEGMLDWGRALGYVYLSHESGHQSRAGDGELATWSFSGGVLPDFKIAYRTMPAVEPTLSSSINSLKRYLATGPASATERVYLQSILKKQTAELNSEIQAQWNVYYNNLRLDALIAGGGYVGQQDAVNMLDEGEFKRKATIMSATLKAVYVPWDLWFTPSGMTGDIKKIQDVVPVNLIISCLLISAGTDFYRASQEKMPLWHIDVVSDASTGAFGLALGSKF